MADKQTSADDSLFLERTLQAAIRIGLVLLLIAWCFTIVRPFVVPVIWGIIIAVATYPGYAWLQARLGGRPALAAALYVAVALVVLILPALALAGTLVDAVRGLAADLSDGSIHVPPPPGTIQSWPLVGEPLFRFWELAYDDLQEALNRIAPELQAIGGWFLNFAGNAGLGLLQFVVAIFIGAALLANAQGGGRVADEIAARLMGPRGPAYAQLAGATIRSVARGILGIALIQATLAGLGFLAVGLPGAGLLALLCLLFIVVQLGPGIVMIPAAIYVFSVDTTTTAIVFAIWCVFVTLIDNVLKPLLLGRGVEVPMLVIFIGAIGGLLSSGILGLFVGPVVLALGYTLFTAWLRDARAAGPPADLGITPRT